MSVLETTDTAAPVLVRADGPAARITLNRPSQRNAMSLDVLGRITEALRGLGEDTDVRAIVFEGTGPAFKGPPISRGSSPGWSIRWSAPHAAGASPAPR